MSWPSRNKCAPKDVALPRRAPKCAIGKKAKLSFPHGDSPHHPRSQKVFSRGFPDGQSFQGVRVTARSLAPPTKVENDWFILT